MAARSSIYLPNGLQAYFLVDDKGKCFNEAPIEVMSDRSPSRKTSHYQISNGLSCIACDDKGMQPLPADEVRSKAGTHRPAEQRLIELFYPPWLRQQRNWASRPPPWNMPSARTTSGASLWP